MAVKKTMLYGGLAALLSLIVAVAPLAAYVALPPLVGLSESLRRRIGWGAALFVWALPLLTGEPLQIIAASVGLAAWLALILLYKRGAIPAGGGAIVVAVATVVASLLVWSAVTRADFGTLAAEYVYARADRPLWQWAARRYFGDIDGMATRAAEHLSEYTFYYALGYAAIVASVATLLFTYAAGYGGTLKNLRLDRKYLLFVFVPVGCLSLLGIMPRFLPFTAAVFYAAVTAPCAAVGFTLLLYAAMCFRGKARIPAVTVAVTLSAALYVFDFGQMALCFIGFADALLPLRKFIDLAAE